MAAELLRQTADAGRAAVDAMLAGERSSVEEAARARARAEELAERRRSEYELARARYRQVEREADAVLARYDSEHGRQLSEKAREKEAKIQWALRQPRSVIVQLPVAWQREAYDRYDRLEEEAAGYRKGLDGRRVEARSCEMHRRNRARIG
jgi:hypothetical protein